MQYYHHSLETNSGKARLIPETDTRATGGIPLKQRARTLMHRMLQGIAPKILADCEIYKSDTI